MKQRPQPARTGFTLVELLLALVIITIVTLIGIPAIGPMISGSSVDGAARLLNRSLMKARSTAVTRHETGTCWIVAGSVYESGTLEPVSSSPTIHDFTGDNAIIVDNDAGGNQVAFTGSWSSSTYQSGFYGANYFHNENTAQGTKSARYTPDIPLAGEYSVYIWYPASSAYASNVPIDIIHKNGTATISPLLSQRANGNQWRLLGTHEFDAGTTGSVLIRTDGTNGHVIADAVKFSGIITVPGGNPATQFSAPGKAWPVNAWAGSGESSYYVTISNQLGPNQTRTVVAPVKENEEAILTADESWKYLDGSSATLQSGSRFMIQRGDPRDPATRAQSVGYGSSDQISWAPLPQGVSIDLKDAVTDEAVWPITFSSSGRAVLPGSASYATIRITSSDAPDNPSHWRYIRIYRNTGRTVTARSLNELPD